MAKCELCGNRIGAGRTLCANCEVTTQQDAKDAKAAEQVRQARCDCGREVIHIVAYDKETGHDVRRPGPIPLCPACYRDEPRKNPYCETDVGRDLYAGLATTNPMARHVCPCGGTVAPVVCFGGKNYYRCKECGAEADQPPVQLEPYKEMTPDELYEKFSDPKRARFGPPLAIKALRKSEGRNINTGESMRARADLDWLVGPEEEDGPPPF